MLNREVYCKKSGDKKGQPLTKLTLGLKIGRFEHVYLSGCGLSAENLMASSS